MDRHAHTIDINLDYQHGDGWLGFQWSDDPVYGDEGLLINFDGFSSRNMPVRSGQGPPDFVDLTSDSLHLRFTEELAARLELPKDLIIRFDLNEDKHAELSRAVDYFRGDYF
jgi:hypothetical protein